MTKSVNPTDPVRLPNALANYHRITKNDAKVVSSTPASGTLQKVASFFAQYFPRLFSPFLKKSEPVSVLVHEDDNPEVYGLLDRTQLSPIASDDDFEGQCELKYSDLPNLQSKLALVSTDIKVLKSARDGLGSGSLKSSDLSERYSILIDKLEKVERDLISALYDLDEHNKSTYVSDLKQVRGLQFPGLSAGFLNVTEEQVEKYLSSLDAVIERSQSTSSAELIPLFIHLDALTRIVDIWKKHPDFKKASGFSESQIMLIEGFVTKAKSLVVMKNLALNSKLLFLNRHEINNLIEKVNTSPKSLNETEKRTLQLLLLLLRDLETLPKTQYSPLKQIDSKCRSLIPDLVKALKNYAGKTLKVKTETSFAEFISNWKKEFPALANIGELQGQDTLFEIYYSLQNRFKDLSNGQKVERMLTERASIEMTSPNFIAEKTIATILVDGKSVVVPDEFEAYIGSGQMQLMINGKMYHATDVVETYKKLRDLATTDSHTDQALLQALLHLTGLSSSPMSTQISLGIEKLIKEDNEFYIWQSHNPTERFVQFEKQEDGSIQVTLRHTSLVVDASQHAVLKEENWDSDFHYKNNTFVDRKIRFEETFTLRLDGGAYVKEDISPTVQIEELSKEQIAIEFLDRMPEMPKSLQKRNDVADQFFAYLIKGQGPSDETTAAYFAEVKDYLIERDPKKSSVNSFAFVHDLVESWKENPELLRNYPDKQKAGIILAAYLYANQEFFDETLAVLEALGSQVGFETSFEGTMVPFKFFERLNRIVSLCNKNEKHEMEELRESMKNLKETNPAYYDRFRAILYRMSALQFSAEANQVIFGEEAAQFREKGMVILGQVLENASKLPLDDAKIEPALTRIMEEAVQDKDKVNVEVRKDLGHRNNDKSFYVDKKGNKTVIDRTDEDSFHRTLSSAMGVAEDDLDAPWLKPMARFYSQLVPNFFLRQAIEDFSVITSGEGTTELFGTNSVYRMSPDHSEITVREIDDNRREVVCRDYYIVKIAPGREEAGVVLQGPDKKVYFEQRVIIERNAPQSGEIKYVARNYSRALYDTNGKQIYNVKKDIEMQKVVLEDIVAGLSFRSSLETPTERREKELKYAKIIAEFSRSPAFNSVMTPQLYRKLTGLFSQEAMDVAFGHLAQGYSKDGLAVRDKYLEAFKEDFRRNFDLRGTEEDLTSTTQKAAEAPGQLPDDVVTDLHRKGENEEFFEDRYRNRIQITGKKEADFHASLSKAMGSDSKWLKPVSRYYSQLIPNKLIFDVMGQAAAVGSQPKNSKKVFGVTSFFVTDHIRSIVTVRQIDDTHMEVMCRDEFMMKLAESNQNQGIVIPDGATYSEQRVMLEMKSPDSDHPTFEASEYSMKVFDANGRLLLDSENV